MAWSKPLIFMHFHGVSLGDQHEIWSKQHNAKVSIVVPRSMSRPSATPSVRSTTRSWKQASSSRSMTHVWSPT